MKLTSLQQYFLQQKRAHFQSAYSDIFNIIMLQNEHVIEAYPVTVTFLFDPEI